MAGSNSPFSSGSSISSLLGSASSIQNQIAEYKDSVASFEFQNSGYTDAAYEKYAKYLKNRIKTLKASGTITSASHALSLTRTLQGATHDNISASIQRESIQIMAGNSTLEDKYNLIAGQYARAVGIGDYTLAQSLESQAYSVSQSIQYKADQAQRASESLAKANEAALKRSQMAVKRGYNDAIGAIKGEFADITQLFKEGNADKLNKAMENFSKQFGATYKELTGKSLPKGAGLTMGSLAQAVFTAEYAYNMKGAQALGVEFDANGNPIAGSGDANGYGMAFAHAAHQIVTGQAKISTPQGDINANQAMQWAKSPNLFGVQTDELGNNKLSMNAITGYRFVNGTLVPVSEDAKGGAVQQSVWKSLDPNQQDQMKKQLQDLGFTIKGEKNGALQVSFNRKTDKWTQFGSSKSDLSSASLLGAGNTVSLIPTSNGGFQFEKDGKLYSIAFDQKGLGGVFQTLPTGQTQHIAGQYGFNQKINTLIANANIKQLKMKEAAKLAATRPTVLPPATSKQVIARALPKNPGRLGGGVAPPSFGGVPHTPSGPVMHQRAGGGFNFSYKGKAISAATYAHITKTPFRTLLSRMAGRGDSGARAALSFVGNDFGYDPRKLNPGRAKLYNALVWGTGRQAPVRGPTISHGQLTLPSGLRL